MRLRSSWRQHLLERPAGGEKNTVRLRVHPTDWNSTMPYVLDGIVPLDQGTYNVSGLEAAWQNGRLGGVSESYLGSFDGFGSAWGTSVTARFFLQKGDYRTYSRERGCFSTPHIQQKLKWTDLSDGCFVEGWGGLELFAMWSYTDLENLKRVSSSVYGDFNETLVGVNWRWNPQLKWSVTWNHAYSNATRNATGENALSSSDTIGLQMNTQY